MTTLTVPGRVPLKRAFLYKGKVFQVNEFGSNTRSGKFQVYSFWVHLADDASTTFIGAGDLDVRPPLPRWLVRPTEGRAELLLSGEGSEQAIYRVCDRFLEKEQTQS